MSDTQPQPVSNLQNKARRKMDTMLLTNFLIWLRVKGIDHLGDTTDEQCRGLALLYMDFVHGGGTGND